MGTKYGKQLIDVYMYIQDDNMLLYLLCIGYLLILNVFYVNIYSLVDTQD